MQFIILTGLSGAGKSCTMRVLEDIGFYCVDNMPPQLIGKFAEICNQADAKIDKVAIATDIRSGDTFEDIANNITQIKTNGMDIKILFLEANNDIIVKRYKETRRKHPLDNEFQGTLFKAVEFERKALEPLREISDYYIDSSYLSTSQLKEQILNIFLDNTADSMIVKVMSFGFKYGAANEADLVFDVRCLPNPFYIPEMCNLTGCDSLVSDYVMSFPQSQTLYDKLKDLFDFLLPLYVKEGKSQLVVAFGCTGGKHRSVTFAKLFTKYFEEKGIKVRFCHRDISKDK